MIISDISYRRKGLCAVTADGKEYLLNAETAEAHGLRKGQQIDRETIEKFSQESEYDRAKSRALWYLSRADHSKKALKDKLCRAFSPDAADAAVERMCELGLIDDVRYAQNVAQALARENKSQKEIMRKLFVKGVPNDIAKQAVEGLSCNAVEQICALLEKKYARRLHSEDDLQKVYAALIRRGFSLSDVRAALKEYSVNIENSEEW